MKKVMILEDKRENIVALTSMIEQMPQDIVYIKSSAGKMLVKRSGIRWKSVTNPIVRYFVNSIQKILLSAIVQLS